MLKIEDLLRIAELEFAETILTTIRYENKIRIILVDNSFIDIYLSQKIENRFGFHWETKDKNNTIYRYDNFPNTKWKDLSTYPLHFHNGSQENVELPPFKENIVQGFIEFMEFVKNKIE